MNKFNVEIQDEAGKWFVAYECENLKPESADKMLIKLREQGFRARTILIDG
jgi:nuclear transport factor 2 (NTF2) superfamily protein